MSTPIYKKHLSFDQEHNFSRDFIGQYDQVRRHPAAEKDEAVKTKLLAIEIILAKMIIQKDGKGSYLHFGLVLENFFCLKELALKSGDQKLDSEIEKVRKYIIQKQRTLFNSIINKKFQEKSLEAFPPNFLKFPALYSYKSKVEKYDSPMHVAARAGNLAAAKILKSHGCSINTYKLNFDAENDQESGSVNDTPLAIAFVKDDVPMAKYFLEKGAAFKNYLVVYTSERTPQKKEYRNGSNILSAVRSRFMTTTVSNHLKPKLKEDSKILDKIFASDIKCKLVFESLKELMNEEREEKNQLETEVSSLKRELDETKDRLTKLESLILDRDEQGSAKRLKTTD